MSDRERRRYVRPRELLAIDERCLHIERDSMFWFFGESSLPNERQGSVAIVHIRGELDHHKSWCGESYEAIVERYKAATTGQDAVDRHAQEHRWDDSYKPIEATVPSCVVLCIDSPGGVVSGLNETVRAIQSIRKKSVVKTVAYVYELAASAAYALACACDAIYCPESAILGSIGVISTMISQAKKNAKDGYDVRLLTTGARKADGLLHAPITDAAVSAEMGRIEKLGASFFGLVSESRDISVAKIRGLQAGIFLGPDAVSRGLADGIKSWESFLGSMGGGPSSRSAGGNEDGSA